MAAAATVDRAQPLLTTESCARPTRKGCSSWMSSISRAAFIGAMGNFSIQYNFTALTPAEAFMLSHNDQVIAKTDTPSDYPEPTWAENALKGLVFAGSLAGMCAMGYLGDLIGRRKGMIVTLSFVVVGAALSAIASWGSADTVYAIIAMSRFILGVGVGGIYPMAAATVAEDSGAEAEKASVETKSKDAEKVGWAFFWQAPGAMAPYAIALLLLGIFPAYDGVTSAQFRLLLGLGVVPALVVLVATWRGEEAMRHTKMHRHGSHGLAAPAALSPWAYATANPEHFLTLLGTGGTWLLFDIAYYGTAIFQPEVLASIFGAKNNLVDVCWQSLVVSTMGIPGTIAAIWCIKRYGGRWLNMWGFLLMAALFAALAITYAASPTGLAGLKFVIFCALTFAFNWGPNVATYVLPAQVFPREVRTTFHGLSAACGKVGAVIGTFIFAPVSNAGGIQAVLWMQVVLSAVGSLVAWRFIRRDAEARAAADEVAARERALEASGASAGSALSDDAHPHGDAETGLTLSETRPLIGRA